MSAALEQIARMIKRESGIELGPSHFASLRAAVERAAPDTAASQLVAACADAAVLDRLINEVTIRETYLFRNAGELHTIDWHAAVARAHARKSDLARVWVAGCSSGEEVYTLAIIACEALGCAAPPVRLTGTDIASDALQQAAIGRYRLRGAVPIEPGLQQRYLHDEGSLVRVSDGLRALVEFRRHNLIRDLVPGPAGAFDVITCRNVLIYFDSATVRRVVRMLEAALAPGGVLVLGAADRLAAGTRSSHRTRPSEPAAMALRGRTPATQRSDRQRRHAAIPAPSAPDRRGSRDLESSYEQGLRALSDGDPSSAIVSLRRVLYLDKHYAPAAFGLGRAYEALAQHAAAARAYERTLETLGSYSARPDSQEQRVDLQDMAVVCHARLGALIQVEVKHRSAVA